SAEWPPPAPPACAASASPAPSAPPSWLAPTGSRPTLRMSRTRRSAGDKLSAPMAVVKKDKKRKKKNGEWAPKRLGKKDVLTKKDYERELRRLQVELVQLEEWVRNRGLRLVAIFEGRDTAGKGGVIKRMTALLNPRYARVVALPAPTERERSQWYFQRYIAHLPSAGEIVFFDRSWYNRAGVEHVMGFCTDEEHELFLEQVPQFERLLIGDGIALTKFWFSVTPGEQHTRFAIRQIDPVRQWKLSPTDIALLA